MTPLIEYSTNYVQMMCLQAARKIVRARKNKRKNFREAAKAAQMMNRLKSLMAATTSSNSAEEGYSDGEIRLTAEEVKRIGNFLQTWTEGGDTAEDTQVSTAHAHMQLHPPVFLWHHTSLHSASNCRSRHLQG